jgi:hypothetical protein
MPNEVRRKLLAEYAVALVAERESWERMREPQLGDAERCRSVGQWKQAAASVRTLARQVRATAPAYTCTHTDTRPRGIQRPFFFLPWVVASSRLVTMWRAR